MKRRCRTNLAGRITTDWHLHARRNLASLLGACVVLTVGTGWMVPAPALAADPVPADTPEAPVAPDATGSGYPSSEGASVTPRGVTRFVVTRPPARRVAYGTPSRITAALVTQGGVGVPGETVELLAKVRPSTRWRRVASGITDVHGKVTLSETLSATAALRLRHPGNLVATDDLAVGSVVVASRVTVAAGQTRTRLGMPVVVRGRVVPARSDGSRVLLQRRVSGSWTKIGKGRMVTSARFKIRWDPKSAGSYVLRVLKPADALYASGTSSTWAHRVHPETAADIARDILRSKRITLAKVHVSGGSYLGSAHENIVDLANGRRARHSCHGGAPCSSTRVDVRLLSAVREMGRRATLTVSEIAGGVHARASAHYSGRGLDITWVNGRHIGAGANYGLVVDRCRAGGATVIFSPSNDPDGGHYNHVHCAWV